MSNLDQPTMEEALRYEEPPDDDDEQPGQLEQQEKSTIKSKTEWESELTATLRNYTEEVKKIARLSVFHVEFTDGTKKIYKRRKAGMAEVEILEEKRAIMKEAKGTPRQIRKALHDFYFYSSQCHLRETRTNEPMSQEDYNKVVFEDFRKIIDACEYVMLYGVPS